MKGALATGYLSTREVEVLRHIAMGCMTKNIANELGISYKTVDKHRDSLRRKLGARSGADLTRRGCELGVVPLIVTPLVLVRAGRRVRYYFEAPARAV